MADVSELFESVKSKLQTIFDELTHVKVITAVNEVTVTVAPDGKTTFTQDGEAIKNCIVTIFDLVDGDVTNIVSPGLKDDEVMRAFHTAQLEKSLTALPDNLNALVNLGKALVHEISQ